MANHEMLRRCFSGRKLYQVFDTALSIPDTSGIRGMILCWAVHDQLQAPLLGKANENAASLAKTCL